MSTFNPLDLQTITDPEANRNPVLQALIRSYQDSSLKANVDPYKQVDDELQGISPGRKFLANLVRGFASGATNTPFQSLQESLVEREINKQLLAQKQQDSALLRIQQLIGQQTSERNTDQRVAGSVATTGMRVAGSENVAGIQAGVARDGQANTKTIADERIDLGRDQLAETTRHNQATEGVAKQNADSLKVAREADTQLQQWKKENPQPNSNQVVNQSIRLSNEFEKAVAPAADIVEQFNKLNTTFATNTDRSPAGDLAMMFTYMKILDRTSVVRESEQRLVADATGLKEKIAYYYDNKIVGTKLNPAQRRDLVTQAEAIVNSLRSSVERDTKRFSDMADKYGLDKDFILYDPFSPLKEKSDTPTNRKVFDAATGEFK